jgi:hypothetical protein
MDRRRLMTGIFGDLLDGQAGRRVAETLVKLARQA